MAFWSWSHTASSNATADSTINWQEGQAPSSINDSARSMMARTAEFRDDISGSIVTGGTSTAYTVTSNQGFDTLAHMNGQIIAFSPHTTNAATVQLNVDGLGLKPLRSAPSTELLAGTIIQGTPYVAIYNNSDGAFYLTNFYSNPYNVPLGAGMDYWGSSTPNSSFAFPIGQAISRTTYATLFALIGTTYGTGDGSTTFNLPDKTGRVSAMKEATATRLTNSGTGNVGIDGGTLGAAGGGTQTLLTANLPAYTPSGTISNGAISTSSNLNGLSGGGAGVAGGSGNTGGAQTITSTQGTSTFSGSAQGGSSTPVKVAQPTIICNYIIRVL